MTRFYNPSARTWKPPIGWRIDRSHRIGRKIYRAWILDPRRGLIRDEITFERATITTVIPASGKAGPCYGTAGSSTQNIQVHDGAILGGKADWSIVAGVVISSTGATANSRAIYCERASSGNDIVKLETGNGTDRVWITYRNDGGTLIQLHDAGDIYDDEFHSIGATKAGTAFKTYLDGLQVASGTFGSASDAFTDAGIKSLIFNDIVGNFELPGQIHYVYLFDSTLSAEDMAWLRAEPYAMFRETTTTAYIDVVPPETDPAVLSAAWAPNPAIPVAQWRAPSRAMQWLTPQFNYDPVPIIPLPPPPDSWFDNQIPIAHWRQRPTHETFEQYSQFNPNPIRNFYPTPVTNVRAVGNPTFLKTTAPGGALPKVNVFIDGIDRARIDHARGVRPGHASQGIRLSKQINSRGTADFTIFDITGAYRPGEKDPVEIYEEGTLRFRGFVDRTTEQHHRTMRAGAVPTEIAVHCTDYGIICDRRVIHRYYTLFMGGLLGIIVGDIINKTLSDTGISLVWTTAASTLIGEIGFYAITVTEAFNTLARIANCDWHVDEDKNLRFFTKTDGYTAAPGNFTDAGGNWTEIKVTRTEVRYANRVYAKSSRALSSVWTDTVAGNAIGIYETTYAQLVVPTITVNSVSQTVVELADIQTQAYDFYYIHNGIGVFRNQAIAQLSPGDTVEIRYPSPLPWVAIAEDTTAIATYGLAEEIVEAGDVTDKVQLQAFADAALARGRERVVEVEILSRTSGFEPGQRVTINTTKPLIASDTFIIEQVDSVARHQVDWEHRIRASSRQFQRTSSEHRYVGDLILRSRAKEDRIIERITFTLAGTIEPLVNPGLTTGVKDAIKVAQKSGVAGRVTLRWKSVDDGTLTQSLIEIDILKNDVSIFGATKVEYPAGATGQVTLWEFATDPYPIAKDDVFTVEILQADSRAHDGTLELTVLG